MMDNRGSPDATPFGVVIAHTGAAALLALLLLGGCDQGAKGSVDRAAESGARHDPLLDRDVGQRAARLAERFKIGQTDR